MLIMDYSQPTFTIANPLYTLLLLDSILFFEYKYQY